MDVKPAREHLKRIVDRECPPQDQMLRNRDREKLVQAMLFFAHNTLYLGKIKLFKLLYLLDFDHFRETGRSVTGVEYRAWKLGPVPFELVQEWDELGPDLDAAVSIQPERVIDFERYAVKPKQPFDSSHFTKRELRLMNALAAKHRNTMSATMIDVTHAENGAWEKVWAKGAGNDSVIPYELSVADDDPHRDAVLAAAAEHHAICAANKE